MLASRFGTAALPDTMADDSMEISSERGHSIGEEDIDIDIDFTAGQVDEDYVLEDVASNAGSGDDIHPQPFPATGHDDLMIDDDFEVYSIPMDDENSVREEDGQNMEREPPATPFPPADGPTMQVPESYSEEVPHLMAAGSVEGPEGAWEDLAEQSHLMADGSMKQSEVTWANHVEAEQAGDERSPPLKHPGEGSREDGKTQDNADTKDALTITADIPQEEIQAGSLNPNPKDSRVGEQPTSSASTSAPDLESSNDDFDKFGTALGVASFSEEIAQVIESGPADGVKTVLSNHEVIVLYQDSEFDLFSKSESDHPDSFFLSDLSVADEPLAKLFEAIRDIIRADLTDEEELCINIEDLGLQIEETSSLTQSTTIAHIIGLHEQLLRNDEAESVPSLCILLSTRANFATRLSNLTSGASEGKGLSQLVLREEQSEGFEEVTEVEGTGNESEEEEEYREESPAESHKSNKEVGDAHESKEGMTRRGSGDGLAYESIADEQPPPATAYSQSINATEAAVADENDTDYDRLAHLADTTDVPALQKNETSGTGEYDEDDLLDYSDEEEQVNQALQKDAKSFPTKLEADDHRTHEEYEAKNEELELRRRSLSQTDDYNALEQPAEPLVVTKDGDLDHEPYLETENGVRYDENDGKHFEQSDVDFENEDPSTDFGEHHATEHDKHNNELFLEDGDVGGSEVLQNHDLTLFSGNLAAQESFEDEIEFEENTDAQLEKYSEEQTPFHDDQVASAGDDLAAPFFRETVSAGSNLGFADAGDSESAASEKTLEALPVPNDGPINGIDKEHEDEIDYEDEDEDEDNGEGVVEVQEPLVKGLQTPNSGSVKRARAEEDNISQESKEAKRPRSS